MSTVQTPLEQRVLLNVTWDGYLAIGEAVRDQPIRMTYSNGCLEIMTKSREHERFNHLLARMVEALTEELEIDVSGGGAMTFQDEELEKGMEPDECYWIQHEADMRGKDDYDPDTDPPPDLAIEVEISRSVLDRLKIYSAIGIPEVWRYDGQAVTILLLNRNGAYVRSVSSKALPLVPVAELAEFLELRRTLGETQVVRRFRLWVRENASSWSPKKRRGRTSNGTGRSRGGQP